MIHPEDARYTRTSMLGTNDQNILRKLPIFDRKYYRRLQTRILYRGHTYRATAFIRITVIVRYKQQTRGTKTASGEPINSTAPLAW